MNPSNGSCERPPLLSGSLLSDSVEMLTTDGASACAIDEKSGSPVMAPLDPSGSDTGSDGGRDAVCDGGISGGGWPSSGEGLAGSSRVSAGFSSLSDLSV